MTLDSAGRIVELAHYGDDLDFLAGVEFRAGIFVPPSMDDFDMTLCAGETLVKDELFYKQIAATTPNR